MVSGRPLKFALSRQDETMEDPLTTGIPFDQNLKNLDRFVFGWLDYALFSLLLLVSVFIGVYFGFFSKQDSTTEYLLGGKRMGYFPVAMSIIARSVIPRSPFDLNERIERDRRRKTPSARDHFKSPAWGLTSCHFLLICIFFLQICSISCLNN